MDYLTLKESEEQITRALARQLGNMELATHVTQVAITTIGSIHRDASDKVATTLATANQIVKAAAYTGRITPEKEAELRRHTQQYLMEMLGITHDAGGKIIDVLLSR
jgi:hypothetical protein